MVIALPPTVRIGNVAYEIVYSFTASRCLIRYEGLFVLADCSADGAWALSGEPASPEETTVIKTFTRATDDTTTTTFTRESPTR